MTFVPNRLPIHNIPSFRLGLNNQQTPEEISDIEMADVENFSVEDDSIVSAPGYAQYGDYAVGPYWGIFAFNKSDGSSTLIRQRGTTLEYDSDDAGTWVACTVPISLTDEKRPTFASLDNVCFYSNGYDSVLSSTDGITWTERASLPKSKYVVNNGANRLVFTGQPGSPYRMDWSNINDGLTVGASSYQLIDPNANGEIVGYGITPQGTNVCFKREGLYEISTFVDNGIIDVNFIGHARVAGHHSISTTEDSILFAGWDTIAYELIGGSIRNITGKISFIGRNNVLFTDKFVSAYYNGKYHLSMPDAYISQDYNAQEYIIYKKLLRNDSTQPYVITRNRRFFGCYGIQDADFSYGRDVILYVGDSRPATYGSPVVTNTIFAFVNDYRDPSFAAGLDGSPQAAFVITKFFTNNIPYYVKRFKKFFASIKVEQDLTIMVSYRFLPYGSWTDVTTSLSGGEMEFLLDDNSIGGFVEGYGFFEQRLGNIFIDIENEEKPRGIQFKISTNEINDVTIYSSAYQMRVKQKFK